MEPEVDYFSRRAAQERDAAREAAHPFARDAHLRMAERYDILTKAAMEHTASSLILKGAMAHKND